MAATDVDRSNAPQLEVSLPDPEAQLAEIPWDGEHAMEVNTRVCEGYRALNRYLEKLYFPDLAGPDVSEVSGHSKRVPTLLWFHFGVYAALDVRRNLRASIAADSLLRCFQEWALCGACYWFLELLRAAADMVGLLNVCVNLVGLLRCQLLCGKLCQGLRLVLTAPNKSLLGKMRSFFRTATAALEHGHRLIFEHIGGATAHYARWRQDYMQRHPAPGREPFYLTIEDFFQEDGLWLLGSGYHSSLVPPSPSTSRAEKQEVEAILSAMESGLQLAAGDLTSICEGRRTVDLVTAGFLAWETGAAAYHSAGELTAQADGWFKMGTGVLMWCEQAEAVCAAFLPAETEPRTKRSAPEEPAYEHLVLPGEVSRKELFLIMTPLVSLRMERAHWSLDADYKESGRLIGIGRETNWAYFRYRYPRILSSFQKEFAALGEASGNGEKSRLAVSQPETNNLKV